ncbi:MAG: alpha-L-rhamnosidase N-terminal domain-containing protein [Verrucomicrobia bacterium]|nr:alpha-L-rhamnosidase N-terminal domain-containing protein [Verrucomicrobiota bacterium]
MNRRDFLKSSVVTSGSVLLANSPSAGAASVTAGAIEPVSSPASPRPRLPDLSPAKWIWYPSGRTLQNTFILFRREVSLKARPRRATGWIAAESRYKLEVNGQRIQWGPPPSDPRWPEADPLDLTDALHEGKNVIGATVLFYGVGDGTWPIGKPGFLFRLEIEHADGSKEIIASDASWKAHLARAWRPGQYKRWYLRALQEEFDARQYPHGWSTVDFAVNQDWLSAMPLAGSPNKPALSAGYYEYMLDVGGGPADTELRPRSIPLMRESLVPVSKLTEHFAIEWRRTPQEYFEVRPPNAFKAVGPAAVTEKAHGQWQVNLDGTHSAALTFELGEQVVGWPFFTIEAPAGTTVELLVHEAHQPGGPPLLNTHFDSWTRFICREGKNRFETFDFESLRWLQLHVHGGNGPVTISEVGVRRRVFPWPHEPRLRTNEPALQRLFDASINTLHNCAQETLVDGMARERQQYSGDGAHQLHAVHLAFGETRLPARFLTTFSQGLTKDGYFLDCWPAYDRLARLVERQLDLSGWGPILDHGVGFNFDCWHHWQYTGDLDALREPYPRLVRFAQYLQSLVGRDDLLPVEDLGIPSVWIDHVAYQRQRHKQCAFNLYAAAMLQHALAPICRAFGDTRQAEAAAVFGEKLQAAAVKRFWSRDRHLFVNNLPWLAEEKNLRTCDRSLATAVLFDQCPKGHTDAAIRSLADCPPEMGFSYPCNAGWRLWALAKGGRVDVIVKDLRTRWATMTSVKENNTLQEDWDAHHDSGEQWSHCAVAPLYIAYHGLMCLKPLAPGFKRVELRPQLGDLEALELVAHTMRGPIHFTAQGRPGARQVTIEAPTDCEAEILLPQEETVALTPAQRKAPRGLRAYQLPTGQAVRLTLRFC